MTSSPTHLARVMAIVDTLDPPTPEVSLRDQLIQSTQAACQGQGLAVTPEAIAAAVDCNLAESTTEAALTPSVAVDYGWKRPASMAALQAEQRRLNRWWRRLYRPSVESSAQLVGFGLYALAASLLSGLFLSHLTAPLMGWHLVCGLGPLGLVLMATGGWRDVERLQALKQPTKIPFDEWYEWKQRRFVRVMIRDCFRSPLGAVLNGDVEAIRREVRRANRAWEAQQAEREQAHTQTTLLNEVAATEER